jgi:hypothetical protein
MKAARVSDILIVDGMLRGKGIVMQPRNIDAVSKQHKAPVDPSLLISAGQIPRGLPRHGEHRISGASKAVIPRCFYVTKQAISGAAVDF